MTNERFAEYSIALYFPSTVTIARLSEILDKMEENGIYIDYASLEFQSDGLYCEALTDIEEGIEDIIKDIGNGDVMLDWDTMSDYDWLPIGEGDGE